MSVQEMGGPGWILGGGLLALAAIVGGAAAAGRSREVAKVNASDANEGEYDRAMAHVGRMQEAVEQGVDVRTLRNSKGLTFQEWAKAAGWSEAAKKLTGMGYEDAEISWQMGEDPPAVREQARKDAWDLATFLNRPQLEQEAAYEAAREAAAREHAVQTVNRALIPGLASPTREAELAVLLAELDQIMGQRGREP